MLNRGGFDDNTQFRCFGLPAETERYDRKRGVASPGGLGAFGKELLAQEGPLRADGNLVGFQPLKRFVGKQNGGVTGRHQ